MTMQGPCKQQTRQTVQSRSAGGGGAPWPQVLDATPAHTMPSRHTPSTRPQLEPTSHFRSSGTSSAPQPAHKPPLAPKPLLAVGEGGAARVQTVLTACAPGATSTSGNAPCASGTSSGPDRRPVRAVGGKENRRSGGTVPGTAAGEDSSRPVHQLASVLRERRSGASSAPEAHHQPEGAVTRLQPECSQRHKWVQGLGVADSSASAEELKAAHQNMAHLEATSHPKAAPSYAPPRPTPIIQQPPQRPQQPLQVSSMSQHPQLPCTTQPAATSLTPATTTTMAVGSAAVPSVSCGPALRPITQAPEGATPAAKIPDTLSHGDTPASAVPPLASRLVRIVSRKKRLQDAAGGSTSASTHAPVSAVGASTESVNCARVAANPDAAAITSRSVPPRVPTPTLGIAAAKATPSIDQHCGSGDTSAGAQQRPPSISQPAPSHSGLPSQPPPAQQLLQPQPSVMNAYGVRAASTAVLQHPPPQPLPSAAKSAGLQATSSAVLQHPPPQTLPSATKPADVPGTRVPAASSALCQSPSSASASPSQVAHLLLQLRQRWANADLKQQPQKQQGRQGQKQEQGRGSQPTARAATPMSPKPAVACVTPATAPATAAASCITALAATTIANHQVAAITHKTQSTVPQHLHPLSAMQDRVAHALEQPRQQQMRVDSGKQQRQQQGQQGQGAHPSAPAVATHEPVAATKAAATASSTAAAPAAIAAPMVFSRPDAAQDAVGAHKKPPSATTTTLTSKDTRTTVVVPVSGNDIGTHTATATAVATATAMATAAVAASTIKSPAAAAAAAASVADAPQPPPPAAPPGHPPLAQGAASVVEKAAGAPQGAQHVVGVRHAVWGGEEVSRHPSGQAAASSAYGRQGPSGSGTESVSGASCGAQVGPLKRARPQKQPQPAPRKQGRLFLSVLAAAARKVEPAPSTQTGPPAQSGQPTSVQPCVSSHSLGGAAVSAAPDASQASAAVVKNNPPPSPSNRASAQATSQEASSPAQAIVAPAPQKPAPHLPRSCQPVGAAPLIPLVPAPCTAPIPPPKPDKQSSQNQRPPPEEHASPRLSQLALVPGLGHCNTTLPVPTSSSPIPEAAAAGSQRAPPPSTTTKILQSRPAQAQPGGSAGGAGDNPSIRVPTRHSHGGPASGAASVSASQASGSRPGKPTAAAAAAVEDADAGLRPSQQHTPTRPASSQAGAEACGHRGEVGAAAAHPSPASRQPHRRHGSHRWEHQHRRPHQQQQSQPWDYPQQQYQQQNASMMHMAAQQLNAGLVLPAPVMQQLHTGVMVPEPGMQPQQLAGFPAAANHYWGDTGGVQHGMGYWGGHQAFLAQQPHWQQLQQYQHDRMQNMGGWEQLSAIQQQQQQHAHVFQGGMDNTALYSNLNMGMDTTGDRCSGCDADEGRRTKRLRR